MFPDQNAPPLGQEPEQQNTIPADGIGAYGDFAQQPVPEESANLLAGKYNSPQELERAYLESQQLLGRQGSELGQLRNQVSSLSGQFQQMQINQNRNPPEPVVDPQTALIQRLQPIAQSFMSTLEVEEDKAWAMAMAVDQSTEARIKAETESLRGITQQMQRQFGSQLMGNAINTVLGTGQYTAVQPMQVAEMLQQSGFADNFPNMEPQQQQQLIQFVAAGLQDQANRNPQPQQQQQQNTMFNAPRPTYPQQAPSPFPGIPSMPAPSVGMPNGQQPVGADQSLMADAQFMQQAFGLSPQNAMAAAQRARAKAQGR